MEFLWYIPNQITPGHRSDTTVAGHNRLTAVSKAAIAAVRFPERLSVAAPPSRAWSSAGVARSITAAPSFGRRTPGCTRIRSPIAPY